jgi:hypothetical protein
MGSSSNTSRNDINSMAKTNFNDYNSQRQQLGNSITGGLGQAQTNSQNAFNTAFGGYSNLLNQAQSGNIPGMGRGGGGGDISAALATLNGMSGPGNPWAGQLGTDIRTRNASLLPGFYDRIKAEQGRLQNIQGGYNVGYSSQMAKLARDQAHQAQQGELEGDIQIGEKSAAAQAAQAAFANQKAMAIAHLQAQSAMAGAAGSRASAAQMLQARLAALSGISGLRGQTPGEVNMYLGAQNANLGQGQGLANQSLGQMYQANPAQAPWWQTALGMVGPAASIAGLFGGGGGGGRTPSLYGNR